MAFTFLKSLHKVIAAFGTLIILISNSQTAEPFLFQIQAGIQIFQTKELEIIQFHESGPSKISTATILNTLLNINAKQLFRLFQGNHNLNKHYLVYTISCY